MCGGGGGGWRAYPTPSPHKDPAHLTDAVLAVIGCEGLRPVRGLWDDQQTI